MRSADLHRPGSDAHPHTVDFFPDASFGLAAIPTNPRPCTVARIVGFQARERPPLALRLMDRLRLFAAFIDREHEATILQLLIEVPLPQRRHRRRA